MANEIDHSKIRPGNPTAFKEQGSTGLVHYAGQISEEFHKHLRGQNAVKVYREMIDNHPLLGGVQYMTETLIGQVDWSCEIPEGQDSTEHVQARELCETAINDMERPFKKFVTEALTFMPFGWSAFEKIYKIRGGEDENPAFCSKYDDGLIGIRDLAPRAQETLFNWKFDDCGKWTALVQQAAPDFRQITLPRSKLVHFAWRASKDNPEGKSALRNAYTSYYRQKGIEFSEGVGVQRNLGGYPVITLPANMFTDDKFSSQLAMWKKIIKRIAVDEQMGLIMPPESDADGNPTGYSFRLMASSGTKAADTDPIVQRYATYILITQLREHLLLGVNGVGSYSLGSDKSDMAVLSLNTIMQVIIDQFNNDVFPELCYLNGLPRSVAPKLVHSDVEKQNVAEMVTALVSSFQTGMLGAWSKDDVSHVREFVGLPPEQRGDLVDDTEEQMGEDPEDPLAFDGYIDDPLSAARERLSIARDDDSQDVSYRLESAK